MSLVEIAITLEGVTPLLMNRFSDDRAAQATAGNKPENRDYGTPREQAEKCLHLDPKGRPIMPQPAVMRCFIEGGRWFYVGKSKVTTRDHSLLCGALVIEEPYFPLKHKQAWKVDTRPVVIPTNKSRILRHRPMFDDWSFSMTCRLETSIIPLKLFRDIVDAAADRCGLLDFRPLTKGMYGRFVVTKWAVSEAKPLKRRKNAV